MFSLNQGLKYIVLCYKSQTPLKSSLRNTVSLQRDKYNVPVLKKLSILNITVLIYNMIECVTN